jgi:5-methylcytosine-specific restriction enzyme subunit McrC
VNLTALDCHPFDPQPSREGAEWLRRLQTAAQAALHVVRLSNDRDDDEPVVYCERDGKWWAGRYVGSLSFEGKRLTILPRFGMNTLRNWLFQMTNIALVESPGELREDDAFIVRLLAIVWGRSFVEAARHGLPALRRESHFSGTSVRGRLDVAGSVRAMASGIPAVVSVRRERSLNNAVSRSIVAAYAVLRRWLGSGGENRWLPARAQELMRSLQAVTGSRPVVPSRLDLQRVRYTPITAAFRPFAELSRQIANWRGMSSDAAPEGLCEGVLLDVAELWELYVLGALRRSAPEVEVQHGTLDLKASQALFTSMVDGAVLGVLKPDAVLLHRHKVIGIVDAKYKRLWPTQSAVHGPQREDLYQLAAYLTRYGQSDQAVWGALVYPQDEGTPPAEALSPWRLDGVRRVFLLTLPHDIGDAVRKLQGVLLPDRGQRLEAPPTSVVKEPIPSKI